MAAVTVGRFTLDIDAGTLEGPAEYLDERGRKLFTAILDGRDLEFYTMAVFAPSVEVAILTRLQTDYAAWDGMRRFMASM